MTRLRKKPVEVDAIQYEGPELSESGGWTGPPAAVEAFLDVHNRPDSPGLWSYDGSDELWIYVQRSAAKCHVERGGWIIAEPIGSGVYPCTAADREAGYDVVG